MKKEVRHWGAIYVGILDISERPPRSLIDSELAESRTFADRLFRDFLSTGRRAVTARLLKSRETLPWPPTGYADRSMGVPYDSASRARGGASL